MLPSLSTLVAAFAAIALLAVLSLRAGGATQVILTIHPEGKPISPDLFGVFFEDLNYAADGGLYAELVQNRSFEYQATEQLTWTPLTAWEFVTREGGRGSLAMADAVPLHPNNPHYVVVEAVQPGAGVGLVNAGFDGIPVRAGEQYDFSGFARQLFTGSRWGGDGILAGSSRLLVRLESKERVPLGEATLEISGRDWQRLAATLTASRTDPDARFVVLSLTKGGVALDEISLFPRRTFKSRPNGLRPDLAQAIADLKPRFMRFPGGCLVHGRGLGNMYRWKDSIGPVEQRRGQANLWGYHQSLGLGYFEYFQFCEDIGAKPLPVVPAGVCCQNADHQGGTGQRGLPLSEMPAFIQDVLDLIEWANGPTNSTWGARRAAAGHPEALHLEYLGVGNEDHITPVFKERFQMIHDAVKAKHPEITVIGTVGPFHSGADFDAGWKIANELRLAMVDEHYYEKPEWFLNNLKRYDAYDRTQSKVYLGEYAAHERNRVNTWRSALAEAAYLTSLERNGDMVQLASYAPLLAREGHTQWRPDLIYFDHTNVLLTANYYVQQLFGQNHGDLYLPCTALPDGDVIGPGTTNLAVSCVRDSRSGDLILKLVNLDSSPLSAQVTIPGDVPIQSEAVQTVLAGDLQGFNTFANPRAVVPTTSRREVEKSFRCEAPPHSLTVLRLATERGPARDVTREFLLDRVHGGWAGMLIGGLEGLPHEFKYGEQPRDALPEFTFLADGARSDDDNDFEWTHLWFMDREGVLKLPYPRLVEIWKANMNEGIWVANKRARELMDQGVIPPQTGSLALNPHAGYNLSGQFCVESYGMIAPGMPRVAADLGLHYARIAVSGEPLQAAQYWTSLVSLMAFHDGPLDAAIDAAYAALDPSSAMAGVVEDARHLHAEHRNDWKAARQAIHEKWVKERKWNLNSTPANGALVLLALLYGEGDFYKTLQLAMALGYDADCNAATAGAVLGTRLGFQHLAGLPQFKMPDRYVNQTRPALPPECRVSDQAATLLRVCERVILANGGERIEVNGQPGYRVRLQTPGLIEALPPTGH